MFLPVFGPCPCSCQGFETVEFYEEMILSLHLTPNWRTRYPSLSGTSLKTCPAWVALPDVRLPPAYLPSSLVHAGSFTRLRQSGETTAQPLDIVLSQVNVGLHRVSQPGFHKLCLRFRNLSHARQNTTFFLCVFGKFFLIVPAARKIIISVINFCFD